MSLAGAGSVGRKISDSLPRASAALAALFSCSHVPVFMTVSASGSDDNFCCQGPASGSRMSCSWKCSEYSFGRHVTLPPAELIF